jgi:cell fate regulator YaaT (PSP1 superfamily)
MPEVAGIRFKPAGKVYHFDAAGLELSIGDKVVVETAWGPGLGSVVIAPHQVPAHELHQPLRAVLRRAQPEDIEQAQRLKDAEQKALDRGQELVARMRLPMKLLSAESNLEGNHFTLFFSAGERVDFRGLVRELSSFLKAKVELRQVGPRDETKILGGMGRCGLRLCCASHLTEFSSISIRMAKEQELPLNPQKISGVCGRLLCCLAYEIEQYRTLKQRMPKKGRKVNTPMGLATVAWTIPLKETVVVEVPSGALVEYPLNQISTRKEDATLKEDNPPS